MDTTDLASTLPNHIQKRNRQMNNETVNQIALQFAAGLQRGTETSVDQLIADAIQIAKFMQQNHLENEQS